MLIPFANASVEIGAVPALLQHTADAQTGFLWMFVLMAATPYVLLVVIGGGIFRARRKQREQEVERALYEQESWEAANQAEDTGHPV